MIGQLPRLMSCPTSSQALPLGTAPLGLTAPGGRGTGIQISRGVAHVRAGPLSLQICVSDTVDLQGNLQNSQVRDCSCYQRAGGAADFGGRHSLATSWHGCFRKHRVGADLKHTRLVAAVAWNMSSCRLGSWDTRAGGTMLFHVCFEALNCCNHSC